LGPDRDVVEDRLRLLGRDAPGRIAEVESEHVGARLDCRPRPLGVADAADFDSNHALNSLIRAAGSSARISASPTRIASAPASRTRLASSAVRMPLSATTTTLLGMSLRNRSVRARSTANVLRSRWL